MGKSFASEADIIEAIRDRVGYRKPQVDVAAELGVSRSYLCEVLAGKKNPGPVLLKALGYDPRPHYRKASP